MTPPTDFVVVPRARARVVVRPSGDDQARAPWLDEAFATYAEEACARSGRCRRPGPDARAVTRGVDFFRHAPFALRRRLLRGRVPARPAEQPHGPRARSAPRCATTRSPTATAGRPPPGSAPRWTPPRRAGSGDLWRRYRRSVGGRPRPVARVRLVARRRRRGARARCRPRSRSSRRAPRRAARPRARRRRGSRPPRASRARAAPRGRSARPAPASNSSTPSIRSTCGTRLSANSVSAARSAAGAMPCRCRSAAASCARLKNGTRLAVVGRDVAPGRQRARGARRAPPRSRRRARASARNAPPWSSTHVAPSSRSARANSAISSCPGPGRTPRRPRRRRRAGAPPRSTGRAPAAPRLDGAEAATGRAACAASGTSPSRS